MYCKLALNMTRGRNEFNQVDKCVDMLAFKVGGGGWGWGVHGPNALSREFRSTQVTC